MKLHITANTSISDLQQQFTELYPDLKMEFFFNGNEGLNLSAMLHRSFPETRMGDLCPQCEFGDMDLPDSTTVSQFEERIRSHFGLPVRVYIKKAGYWLKSRSYDNLPLRHQELV